jgi:thymidylate synthase (FAD)
MSKTSEEQEAFIHSLVAKRHESVIEHSMLSVRFICDRGISHELVRHRLASFSQESTRYCKYKENLTFIIPPWIDIAEGEYHDLLASCSDNAYIWLSFLLHNEKTYLYLLEAGWTPQEARSVLPNALKTELVVTANFREWKRIFQLRLASVAHPQMRELLLPLYKEMVEESPVIFGDLSQR